jgi:hypothetical protein
MGNQFLQKPRKSASLPCPFYVINIEPKRTSSKVMCCWRPFPTVLAVLLLFYFLLLLAFLLLWAVMLLLSSLLLLVAVITAAACVTAACFTVKAC